MVLMLQDHVRAGRDDRGWDLRGIFTWEKVDGLAAEAGGWWIWQWEHESMRCDEFPCFLHEEDRFALQTYSPRAYFLKNIVV